MSLQNVLFNMPWISYNDKFLQSRIVLAYPENVIFTAQFLKHVMESDIYKTYPYAEKINCSAFQDVDWNNSIIVFNNDLQLILAPDPVHKLVRLNSRLEYEQAATAIFESFRFIPHVELFRYQGIVIFLVFFFYGLKWLNSLRYRIGSLTLSSKSSTA